jgi:hypothetical protein
MFEVSKYRPPKTRLTVKGLHYLIVLRILALIINVLRTLQTNRSSLSDTSTGFNIEYVLFVIFLTV